MIEVKAATRNNSGLCDTIFEIRRLVFVEEQKVSRDEEFDSFEESSVHYLGTINGIAAGTARWRITENGIKLERFAVLKEFRKQGVAAAVLKRVVGDIRGAGVKIYLNAQIISVAFYEKYGFAKEGEMFSEANIDHYRMYLKQ